MVKKYLLLTIMLMIILSTMSYGFTMDEMMEMDKQSSKSDFMDFIKKAEDYANDWSFSSADEYLEKAKKNATTKGEKEKVKSVEKLIAKNEAAYEKRQAEKRAEKEEADRVALANARNNSNSSSGASNSGSTVDWVNVDAKIIDGFFGTALVRTLSLSGSPGTFSDDNGRNTHVAIFKGYNGKIAGTYSYTMVSSENKVYSGTIRVSGTKRNITIRVYGSGGDAGTSEY